MSATPVSSRQTFSDQFRSNYQAITDILAARSENRFIRLIQNTGGWLLNVAGVAVGAATLGVSGMVGTNYVARYMIGMPIELPTIIDAGYGSAVASIGYDLYRMYTGRPPWAIAALITTAAGIGAAGTVWRRLNGTSSRPSVAQSSPMPMPA